ncbi:type II secretion system protein N [Sphingomonas sp. CFBP 13720]|uniref:type II secretion system protein N n=1 Tax=Sphingomonas sp. CFBP 13720 TaxID=2775302 RepID=UPI00177E351C|nr:type II secretion system protein N [Sphingomonas sp. CFBP 13720]MBD8678177.1 signaling protein [Sphingomonas sp. CFBP 13720]
MIVLQRLRSPGRAIDLLAGVAIVSVAFALAGLVWRMAGHADTGAITVPSAARARSVAIDPAPALAWSPFGSPTAADATAATSIQAVLKGVVFARPAELSTAFVAIGNEPAKPVRAGDAVAGATITEIRRDRIILNNGGRLEYLAFPDPFGLATPAPGTAAPPAPGQPAPPQPQPAAATPPGAQAVLSRLNATQVPGGYAVGANPPPGMRAGDVVQSVNGAAMTDQSAVNAAIASAGMTGQAQVTILRDGKPITVTVPIR